MKRLLLFFLFVTIIIVNCYATTKYYSASSAIETGRFSTTQTLSASDAISDNSSYVVIQSSGGAVSLTSDPQISDGNNGQLIEIWGNSDTDTITLSDGSGLKLSGDVSFTLGVDDVISLRYVNSEWCELFRSDN